MPDNEKEPEIEMTRKDVIIHVPTVEAIAEALPPTVSIEDRNTIAKQTLETLTKHDEETRRALEEERSNREIEHEEVVKWRRISIAITVLLGSISIYLGYLALVVR
jgi:hypothetical protein